MASSYEIRRDERRRLANASRSRPTRDYSRVNLGRSVYEDEARYEEEPADPEEAVTWTPLAKYKPFGRKLAD